MDFHKIFYPQIFSQSSNLFVLLEIMDKQVDILISKNQALQILYINPFTAVDAIWRLAFINHQHNLNHAMFHVQMLY